MDVVCDLFGSQRNLYREATLSSVDSSFIVKIGHIFSAGDPDQPTAIANGSHHFA
jgi:hypothetical protein